MATVDLTAKRLIRLEKLQQRTNTLLGYSVEVLEAHSRHFARMEEATLGVAKRVDQLAGHVDRLAGHVDRLAGHVDRLAGHVDQLAGHVDQLAGHVGYLASRLTARLDRLIAAIARGRTQDLTRFADHERRLRALETRPRKR